MLKLIAENYAKAHGVDISVPSFRELTAPQKTEKPSEEKAKDIINSISNTLSRL